MALETKICGVKDRTALAAVRAGGADFVGFIFFPRSPRNVSPAEAAALARERGPNLKSVAVVVDADDALLAEIARTLDPDLWQFHGRESPQRVAEVKARFGKPVMKAIPVSEAADLEAARPYLPVADRLVFDAKPPKDRTEALPGGNAVSFDWRLLAGQSWPLPWLLSGGLKEDNLETALAVSGARGIDLSSGVESRPGVKDPEMIARLLKRLKQA